MNSVRDILEPWSTPALMDFLYHNHNFDIPPRQITSYPCTQPLGKTVRRELREKGPMPGLGNL